FRKIEDACWSTLVANDDFVQCLDAKGVRSDALRIHAEILFCLRGLKAVVIASEIPARYRGYFWDNVVVPSGIDGFKSDQAEIVVRQLDQLQSPCLDLSGSLVFINIRHSFYPQVGPNLFSRPSVSDSTLARLLNYPVALDTVVPDQAVEIAYRLKECGTISMTYVANRNDLNRVQQHFKMFCDRAGILLELDVANLSSREGAR
ncbi:hypothetical protein BVRB_031630, partial [Beta vulgaris subsp. vulgaris]